VLKLTYDQVCHHLGMGGVEGLQREDGGTGGLIPNHNLKCCSKCKKWHSHEEWMLEKVDEVLYVELVDDRGNTQPFDHGKSLLVWVGGVCVTYHPVCVIEFNRHSENEMGHYTAWVRMGDHWWHCDDENITRQSTPRRSNHNCTNIIIGASANGNRVRYAGTGSFRTSYRSPS
jgi:hypothetical protein